MPQDTLEKAMKRLRPFWCLLWALAAWCPAAAQEFYPDFALVVDVPGFETFLANFGDSPIRVDGYLIVSPSASLTPDGWARMGSAGSAIVAALGPGADQFFAANPTESHLGELNPLSSATWQPGQSWSIGVPFATDDLNLIRQTVFQFSSPDGLVLTGGTVVPPGQLFPAAVVVVPEPSTGALCLFASLAVAASALSARRPLRLTHLALHPRDVAKP
jgi:hypothetical protein